MAVTKVLITMVVMEVLTMMAVMEVLSMIVVMEVLTTMVVIAIGYNGSYNSRDGGIGCNGGNRGIGSISGDRVVGYDGSHGGGYHTIQLICFCQLMHCLLFHC